MRTDGTEMAAGVRTDGPRAVLTAVWERMLKLEAIYKNEGTLAKQLSRRANEAETMAVALALQDLAAEARNREARALKRWFALRRAFGWYLDRRAA